MNNIPQYLNIEYSNKNSGYPQTTVLEYDNNRHIYFSQSQSSNNYINLVWKGKNCKIPGMWPRWLRKERSGCWLLTIDNQEWIAIRSRQEINNGISADQWIPNARSTNALSPIYRIYVSPLRQSSIRRRPPSPPTTPTRHPTEAIRIPPPNPAPDRDIWDSVFHSRDQKTRSPGPQITTNAGLANLAPLSTTSRFGNNLGGGKSRKKLRKYRKSRKLRKHSRYKKLRKHSRYKKLKKYKSSRKYKI